MNLVKVGKLLDSDTSAIKFKQIIAAVRYAFERDIEPTTNFHNVGSRESRESASDLELRYKLTHTHGEKPQPKSGK